MLVFQSDKTSLDSASREGAFLLLHTLTSTCIVSLFILAILMGIFLHLIVVLHFPNHSWDWAFFFSCPFFPLCCLSFKNRFGWITYSDFKPFVDYVYRKYLPVLWLNTLKGFFWWREVLNLKIVQFINLFPLWIVLLVTCLRRFCHIVNLKPEILKIFSYIIFWALYCFTILFTIQLELIFVRVMPQEASSIFPEEYPMDWAPFIKKSVFPYFSVVLPLS